MRQERTPPKTQQLPTKPNETNQIKIKKKSRKTKFTKDVPSYESTNQEKSITKTTVTDNQDQNIYQSKVY